MTTYKRGRAGGHQATPNPTTYTCNSTATFPTSANPLGDMESLLNRGNSEENLYGRGAVDEANAQFRSAMHAAGLEPPEILEPGKIHRFPGVGKRPSNRAGWCKLFEDGLAGCFGDWSSGLSEIWQASGRTISPRADRATFIRRVEAAKKQERERREANAASRAARIWDTATPAPDNHTYLVHKHIQPHWARLYKGVLALPVRDFTGRLTSLQFIDANGRKRLLAGGRKRGCFIPVAGDITNRSRIIVCEGWATGCTLAEDEPTALVLAAIDAGNLESVAVAARHRWPSTELVIAGDDDRLTSGNPGATKAKAAAIASGALLALPPWPEDAPERLTDFNDLAVWLTGGGV